MKRLPSSILLIGGLASVSVNADTLILPDPWEIIHVARTLGSAEVGRDAMKDPRIVGEVSQLTYSVDFYGCWLGRACQTIMFRARLMKDNWKPGSKAIASWNAEKLFGRAWRDGEGVAVLDHAVSMRAGLPEDTLLASFEAWRRALLEFADHVDFQ